MKLVFCSQVERKTKGALLWALCCFSVLFFCLQASASSARPKWFPTVSCEEAWNGKNIYRYNFQKDSKKHQSLKGNFGYPNYEKRVAKLSQVQRRDCYKEWTILVFMAANNDLTPYAFWDLYEMEASYRQERAASTLTSDLLVDVQSQHNKDLRRFHMFQTNKKFDRNRDLEDFEKYDFDKISSPIAHFEKTRTGSPEDQLLDFVNWGVRHYPAKNTMVIVWGHGEGWSSGAQAETINPGAFHKAGRFGGLAFQDGSETHLTTPALSRVLEQADQAIDVYASDACLMQMLEVAYELAPHTRYIVGSAQVQSYLGLPYRRMMYEINRGCYGVRDNSNNCRSDKQDQEFQKSIPPAHLVAKCDKSKACYVAHMLPILAKKSYHQRGLQGRGDKQTYKRMTMSSIDARELEAFLASYMNKMAKAMLTYLHSIKDDKEEVQALKDSFANHLEFLGQGREASVTLGLLKTHLRDKKSKEALELYNTADEIQQWFGFVTVERSFGSDYENKGYHLLGFKGLALWIPKNQETLDGRIEDFKKSRLYKSLETNPLGMTYWEQWMRLLYKKQGPTPL